MTDSKNFIEKLQEKPLHTRVKILWGTVGIVAIILVFLMINSAKNTVSNAGENWVKVETSKPSVESPIEYASVERAERVGSSIKIYFNLSNPTNDILNVPKVQNIKLIANGKTTSAQTILDRQGNAFVQKILSKTKNFGTLTFPTTDEQNVQLVFGGMFLEKTPSDIFQQTLDLDLAQLSKSTNVRN